MRIQRVKSTFGERKKVFENSNPRKKYFLAYEGVKTEVQYFNGVCNHKEYLNISASVELVPLLRHSPHIGWSNPLKVFDRVNSCLKHLSKNERNVDSFVNAISDYCFNESEDLQTIDERNELYKTILNIFEEKFNLGPNDNINFSDDEIISKIIQIMSILSKNLLVKNIENFIYMQCETYDQEYDCVCLIVDRDKKSFTNNQYDKLINSCKKYNYHLYVTNPCFEF